jgi:hypothetical protein
MKSRFSCAILLIQLFFSVAAQNISALSPSKDIRIEISNIEQLSYSVFYKRKKVTEPSQLGFSLTKSDL